MLLNVGSPAELAIPKFSLRDGRAFLVSVPDGGGAFMAVASIQSGSLTSSPGVSTSVRGFSPTGGVVTAASLDRLHNKHHRQWS